MKFSIRNLSELPLGDGKGGKYDAIAQAIGQLSVNGGRAVVIEGISEKEVEEIRRYFHGKTTKVWESLRLSLKAKGWKIFSKTYGQSREARNLAIGVKLDTRS